MGDFFNLVTPFFSTPTTYAQMLKKLAGLAFYEVFLITFLLRSIPEIDNALKSIESLIPHSTTYNLGGLAIALLVALLSHIIHLHDRISDALGIRRRFDRNHILIPLARLVGVRVTPRREEAMAQNRDRLMREVFYKYASSRAEHPLVDKHDIEHALGQWAWFWAFVKSHFDHLGRRCDSAQFEHAFVRDRRRRSPLEKFPTLVSMAASSRAQKRRRRQ